MTFTPQDWYWDDGVDVFSSKVQARVPYSDPNYQDWLARGNLPTRDPGETELREVLANYEIGLTPAETQAFVDQRLDLAAARNAYVTIQSDLTTIVNLSTPLTAAQRDASIQGLARHLKTILKGLRFIFQKVK